MTVALTHLERLESESIHIMREVVADNDKPVMRYSVADQAADEIVSYVLQGIGAATSRGQ